MVEPANTLPGGGRVPPDTPENLEKIVKQTSNAVRNQIGLKGIRELSADGIRVEAGYNVLSGWHLVTSIWY